MSAKATISSNRLSTSCARQAQDAAVQDTNVLTARELGRKPAPSSSSADTRPLDRGRSRRRGQRAGQDLQERRLAGAVAADDCDRFALAHLERHVAQAPSTPGPAARRAQPNRPRPTAANPSTRRSDGFSYSR